MLRFELGVVNENGVLCSRKMMKECQQFERTLGEDNDDYYVFFFMKKKQVNRLLEIYKNY